MTTQRKLQEYQTALELWKKRGGLNGQGGIWLASERRYGFAAEPTPEQFKISDGWTLNVAKQIRERILK